MPPKTLNMKDLELIVEPWALQWLKNHIHQVAETWAELVRMYQITDISLAASARNNVFVFHNQQVQLNINIADNALGGAASRADAPSKLTKCRLKQSKKSLLGR